jgi:hypothetical protein
MVARLPCMRRASYKPGNGGEKHGNQHYQEDLESACLLCLLELPGNIFAP